MALSAILSAPPCPFDYTEQNLTSHDFSFRSTPIIRSSSSVTTSCSLVSEDEVISVAGSVVNFQTSLHTLLYFMVFGGQTIDEVKEEVMRLHSSAFPRFGEIKIIDIKLKCQSYFHSHSLEDFMHMRMILNERKHLLLLYVDASSSVEHHEEQLVHNGSDADEDSLSEEESGDLPTCFDSPVPITPSSICLQGLGASSHHSISEQGDRKRNKPKISGRKKDPKGKRHIPKRAGNSVPTIESCAKANEENFHTAMACEGTLQSYSSNKVASWSRKALRSDEKSSNDSTE